MVGVAGKSKGCATCRRRKIRCDLATPACNRCLKAGRTCEGYERFPVFLNRTQQGVEKRSHLAEAKIVPAAALNEQQLLSWFWEAHTWQPWLHCALDVVTPNPTLKLSMRALAVTRHGRLTGDEHWVVQGRRSYSEALATLQRALETQPFHDETLASARALVLYEFLESTSESPNAWETHLGGLEKLLIATGKPTSTLGKAVFVSLRYPLMCRLLMRRERSVLSQDEWLMEGKEEQMWNYGFKIAAMMQDAEQGKDVRQMCVELYKEVDGLEETDSNYVMHQRTFRLSLLMMMERFGVPPMGDQETEARACLEQLQYKIVGGGTFHPSRTLLPVNFLAWYYRHRPEGELCTRMKDTMTKGGYLLVRDINVGEIPVATMLRDRPDQKCTRFVAGLVNET